MKPEEREMTLLIKKKSKRKMAGILVGKIERCYWTVIPRGDANMISPIHSIISRPTRTIPN